jgi:hypothetical protein
VTEQKPHQPDEQPTAWTMPRSTAGSGTPGTARRAPRTGRGCELGDLVAGHDAAHNVITSSFTVGREKGRPAGASCRPPRHQAATSPCWCQALVPAFDLGRVGGGGGGELAGELDMPGLDLLRQGEGDQ